MNLVEVHIVGFEVFQRTMACLNYLVIFEMVGENLGGVDHLLSNISQRFAHYSLGMTISIIFGCIHRGYARLKRSPKSPGGLGIINTHPHVFAGLPGTHDDGSDFYITRAKRTQFHGPPPDLEGNTFLVIT